MRVLFGEPPVEVVQALKKIDAQANGLLERHTGTIETRVQLQTMYDRDLPEAKTRVFDDPYPSWLSICLSRLIKVAVHGDGTVGWVEDERFLEALHRFESEGNPYLDASFPRLLSAMWPMNPGRLVYGDPRCLCIIPGRAAFRTPKLTLTIADWGVHVTRKGGWAVAPTETLTDALAQLPTGEVDSLLTADASPWFMVANAEQDDLRRFVFAFAGLEVLASQVAKHRRPELTHRLGALDEGAPWVEFLWPDTDEERVNRNLVFKFAMLAYLYSPTTAQQDAKACKTLAKFRNNLFHGNHREHENRDNSIACKELLGRFLAAVSSGA